MSADHVKHWFLISRDSLARSYSACSRLGKLLKPETKMAALSLYRAKRVPISAKGIHRIMHEKKPMFIKSTFPKSAGLWLGTTDEWTKVFICQLSGLVPSEQIGRAEHADDGSAGVNVRRKGQREIGGVNGEQLTVPHDAHETKTVADKQADVADLRL